MQRLVDILLAFKEYVVLTFLIVVSIILLNSNDNSQIRAIRSYTVGFFGVTQDFISIVPNVFALKRENEILRQLSVNLSDEVNRLREARLENMRLREIIGLKEKTIFKLVAGEIVGKNIHLLRNTITLNIGEADGAKPDMAIISEHGLVGKLIAASDHYSVGQIMLNKDFRSSAKIQRNRVDGIISWSGGEIVNLENISKMQDVKEGDVVTTSEYSTIFPPDVKIGYVSKVSDQPGSLFKNIEVTPSVEFSSLEQVFVVIASVDSERVALENKIARKK
ncbi:MAG: rod shape-determining protein MreC [Ignavibacteriales bacterium]|nr:rod shape-determining protein MreC [Ignavibacteriales bacterium]